MSRFSGVNVRGAWLIAFGTLVAACIPKRTGVPTTEKWESPAPAITTAPSAAPVASSAPASSAAKLPPPPADDPASCIDSPRAEAPEDSPWRKEVEARVQRGLKTIAACAKTFSPGRTEMLTVRLAFDQKGVPTRQLVSLTTLSDCGVAQCVKSKLAALHAPAPRSAAEEFEVPLTFELKRGGAVLVSNDEQIDAAYMAPELQGKQLCLDDFPVSGRLPPELIQSIVRKGFGQLRRCYEAGLGRNPDLEGRVEVRFVIGIDGQVTSAGLSGNTLPDCEVARCVVDGFRKLSFPKPQGGIVTVVYPIMLAPG